MSAAARRKGLNFERELARKLREVFPGARRQLENHAADAKGIDLQGTGSYKFQCKKLKKYAPVTCIEEVQCSRMLGDLPVLVTAGDGQEAVAVLYLDDFLALVRRLESYRPD